MIALLFGEEKNANPVPIKRKIPPTKTIGICVSRNEKPKMPIAVIAIPAEATRRGSCLSDSVPASGDSSAIIIGCSSMKRPAVEASKPRMSCRYRDSRKLMAKVAL